MQIKLTDISKRYNYEWIFRGINYEFTNEYNYVILGANGSGKSTLLQVIAGNIIASKGELTYDLQPPDATQSKRIPEDAVFRHLSIAAPYLELFEELTLIESIEFQAKFKPFYEGLDSKQIVELTQLSKEQNKELKYYSSGMKQRVRLAFAILCQTPLLLLDEPTSNLDKKSIDWYLNLIDQYSKNRLIIVCSNQQEYEYPFCNKQLHLEEYK